MIKHILKINNTKEKIQLSMSKTNISPVFIVVVAIFGLFFITIKETTGKMEKSVE